MAFNSVREARDLVPVRHVLASVYDKTGLAEFARGILSACPGVRFYSTGGSFDALAEALGRGAHLVKVSDYTGQPEMKGGLVKTLDWKIYLGLLAEDGDSAHEADLAQSKAVAFDMVISNLYPFVELAADPSARPEDLRQRIDIGGPSMTRAAAKNYLRVASVSSPTQYGSLLGELRENGGKCRLETRRRLAAEAFDTVSRYDAAISSRLGGLDPAVVAAAYGL